MLNPLRNKNEGTYCAEEETTPVTAARSQAGKENRDEKKQANLALSLLLQ